MTYQVDSAFTGLFRAFTSDSQSIGAHLTQQMDELHADDALLVSTGTDLALFPGRGQTPSIESFRKSTRGFIELTAISHLPLALAYIARMRELSPDKEIWRMEVDRLLHHARETQAANSIALWREQVALESFVGFEQKLANLVDYTCASTITYLEDVKKHPEHMSFQRLRETYFDPSPGGTFAVPMNDVMFATFGLAYLDIVYRISNWLAAQSLDWSRAMVLVSGQSGRPTAGSSWASNNMCHLIWRASQRALPLERLYVAPHAPSFNVANLSSAAELAELERGYRKLWLNTRASVEVSRELFDGYPGYQFTPSASDGMPTIRFANDRVNMIARMRRIMEDPAQLLSNCVADYIADQLYNNGNCPAQVEIPGFTNIEYPKVHIE